MKFLNDINQKHLISLMPIVFAIGFLMFFILNNGFNKQIVIGGDIYNDVMRNNKLVSDTLPPPLSLLPVYAEVHYLADITSKKDIYESFEKIGKMKDDMDKSYNENIQANKNNKDFIVLINKLYNNSSDFFDVFNRDFAPAIKLGNNDKARYILEDKLLSIYKKSESYNNEIINLASEEHKESLLKADMLAKNGENKQKIAGILIFSIVAFITYVLRRKIIIQDDIKDDMASQMDAISRCHAVIVFKKDSSIISANNNFLSLMGYELASDIEGKHHRIFVADEHYGSKEYEELWKNLRNGQYQQGEFCRKTRSGKTVWIQASYNPIVDKNGEITKIVKFAYDITDQVEMRKKMESILEGVIRNAKALSTASTELAAVSQHMTETAENTSLQASSASAASEQITKNVQTVAAGTEEMSMSIREIAGNAAEAARVARHAVMIAENTNATVTKLGDSSNEIGNVIKVITSIAQQTKLLALNATIEAARAGEAGKGFAVVANEVKELAKETARATEDISHRIETIQLDTQGAVDAIREIGVIINQISDIQTTIASAVEEQTATTNEMGRNVSESAQGSNEITANINGVAHAAQETSEGAEKALQSAHQLAIMASELESLVSRSDMSMH